MLKILIVDDDVNITRPLKLFMQNSGFSVDVAGDGVTALRMVETFAPDLIVLDVMMPPPDGREVLRRLRSEGNVTPIIMLTQRDGGAPERAITLMEGADDYVNKPYDPLELVARIRAVLRRTAESNLLDELTCDELKLDRGARIAYLSAEDVQLTPKAFSLLEYMMLNANLLLTREQLLTTVWGWASESDDSVVNIRIAEIRRKIKDKQRIARGDAPFIETARGSEHDGGYRFIGKVTRTHKS
jgi:DNA-binding response OmpR family regulator